MAGFEWYWILAIAAGAVLVYRLGFGIGRMTRDADMVPPVEAGRISPTARPAIEDAIRRGARLEAIRLLREDTGCSLVAAKKTVEGMMQ